MANTRALLLSVVGSRNPTPQGAANRRCNSLERWHLLRQEYASCLAWLWVLTELRIKAHCNLLSLKARGHLLKFISIGNKRIVLRQPLRVVGTGLGSVCIQDTIEALANEVIAAQGCVDQ